MKRDRIKRRQRGTPASRPSSLAQATRQPFDPTEVQRAIHHPKSLTPQAALQLQNTHGNRFVTDLMKPQEANHPIQAKLTVTAAGDQHEQEADRIASAVVGRMALQRQDMPEDELMLSRDSSPAGNIAASPALEAQISSARGSGKALPDRLMRSMGNAFAADFHTVRVHTDSRADGLSRAMQAKAFTTGQDIFFRSGAFDPGSQGGQELLAHELTHVVQQGSSNAPRNPSTSASPVIQRATVKIGNSEQLKVDDGISKTERKKLVKEAKAIIKRIKKKYGIVISSKKSVKTVIEDYQLDKQQQKEAQARPWEIKELRALEAALDHYAPLLGKNRQQSSLQGTDQTITNIGAMDRGVSINESGNQYFEDTTFGETFMGKKNVTIFSALTDSTYDFDDNEQMIRGTIVHELSHGLIEGSTLGDFVKMFRDYWADEDTRVSGDSKIAADTVEAPITKYGADSAAEDLAETAMFYFEAPQTLRGGNTKINPTKTKGSPGNPAPKRADFFKELETTWTKSPEVAKFRVQYQIILSVNSITKAAEKQVLDDAVDIALAQYKLMDDSQKIMYREALSWIQYHYMMLIKEMQRANASPSPAPVAT